MLFRYRNQFQIKQENAYEANYFFHIDVHFADLIFVNYKYFLCAISVVIYDQITLKRNSRNEK